MLSHSFASRHLTFFVLTFSCYSTLTSRSRTEALRKTQSSRVSLLSLISLFLFKQPWRCRTKLKTVPFPAVTVGMWSATLKTLKLCSSRSWRAALFSARWRRPFIPWASHRSSAFIKWEQDHNIPQVRWFWTALYQQLVLCAFQPSGSGSVRRLLADTKTLRQILEEADSLFQVFWRAALPKSEETKQVRNKSMCPKYHWGKRRAWCNGKY